jgi:glycerol-3-phosphate dehydrogenase
METNRLFPQANLARADIHFSYAGVRPLPKHESGPESAITRKHIIKKHRILARGLVSIIGGKLTTYRNLAEQTVNYVDKKNGMKGSACVTRKQLLPGALNLQDARSMIEKFDGLSAQGGERLLGIYGGRSTQLLKIAEADSEMAVFLDGNKTILTAEVCYAIQYEYAVTLIDIIYRRMMLGLSENQGVDMVEQVADIAANCLGWSKAERKDQVQTVKSYSNSFLVDA